MPLVIPDLSSSGNKTDQWQSKLVGKKISESTSNETTFAKTDLPKEHRVIPPGSLVTKDFKPDRLNVHLGEDGTVTHVDYQ